ncbi:MAG: deoxyribonuclease IV [Thermomicrobiales bacterium]|nr:deoxyribonuclease IV [Thermomicrobiales bacterium]
MHLLGAHMSIEKSHALAIDRAAAFEMTALQIFTKNASRWQAKPIEPVAAETFRERLAGSDIAFTVAHDSYLINMGSPDDELWEKSLNAFQDEMARCAQLGVPYLVTHPGAHMGTGVEAGIARVAEGINRLFDEEPDNPTVVLLETTAGQGTTLGSQFEELAGIIDQVENTARVAVCFDTCHVFAAGYDLRTPETYEATMQAFDEIIGLERLVTFHLNDSKKGLGLRTDRHAHIGEGELGLEAFRLLLTDPRFADTPGVLETPKDDDQLGDQRNMRTLRDLANVAAPA